MRVCACVCINREVLFYQILLVMTLMKDKLDFIQPCNATYGFVELVNGPLTGKSH